MKRREIQRKLEKSVWNTGGCASWYLDRNGKNTVLWPDFTWRYRLRTKRFDAESYGFAPAKRPLSPAAPAPWEQSPVATR